MSFSISHLQEKGLSLVSLKEESTGTEAILMPAHGAAVFAFLVRTEKGSFNVIDTYKDLSELKTEMGRSFKGSKLSPFPCRIAGAKYSFENKEHIFNGLFPDGTAIHGLLFDKEFIIEEALAGEASACLTMEYLYDRLDPAYPHQYSCRVKYTLRPGNILEVDTTVTNTGEGTMPIADGWHPYFQLGGRVDDWWLQFGAAAIVEFDAQLIPTGRLLKYDSFNKGRLIGTEEMDNCFLLEPPVLPTSGTANKTVPACELFNRENGLRVSFFPGAGYPYLQLYTPPGRQSIAVENLSSAPDSFNNKMGLLLLGAGDSQTFTVNYKVGVE
ncbi:MAG TPA: aldose 1-epimerase [Puia sp.]|nr:aldose 1-epimerase [Puia sp.]